MCLFAVPVALTPIKNFESSDILSTFYFMHVGLFVFSVVSALQCFKRDVFLLMSVKSLIPHRKMYKIT